MERTASEVFCLLEEQEWTYANMMPNLNDHFDSAYETLLSSAYRGLTDQETESVLRCTDLAPSLVDDSLVIVMQDEMFV